MYKLILVDDESEIRQGLKEVIPFESLGFTVVGEAGDGMEALRLCEALEPDLLITDIRMPLMDGLTLCRKAKALLPMLKCIILSGYDDFEYARQAVSLQAMSYLLKPISSSEFREMLEKAGKTLDEEFSRRKNISLLQEHFQESLPLLREALLCDLLNGRVTPEAALKKAEKYALTLTSPFYALACLRVCENTDEAGIEDEDLRLLAAKDILREFFHGTDAPAESMVFSNAGQISALFLCPEDSNAQMARLTEWIDEARKTVRHYLGCVVYVGVSAPCARLSQLPVASREATAALYQCMLGQVEQVLCITDLQQRKNDVLVVDEVCMNTLSNSLRARDTAVCQAALTKLMDSARHARPSPQAWQAYLLEIFICFLRVISEQALSEPELERQSNAFARSVLQDCPSVEEAQSHLESILSLLLGAIEANRQTSSKVLASQAEQFIQENYMKEDTALEQLCLHLHISPSYFSLIFKKETKKTFHQYLTDLRMDKALALLSTTDQKIAQVAESVGLPDHSYFSYCFKKHFGFPPSRARNS